MMDLGNKTNTELAALYGKDYSDNPKVGFDLCCEIRDELYTRRQDYSAKLANSEARYWQGYWHRDRRDA